MQEESSREALLAEITRLRQQVHDLTQEQAALDRLLQTLRQPFERLQPATHPPTASLAWQDQQPLSQFLDVMPVGIFVVDATGKLRYANWAAQLLFEPHLSFDQVAMQFIKGERVYLAGTQQPYPLAQLPLLRALRGESVRVEDMEIHLETRILPLEIRATPIVTEAGDVAYAIATVQDITDRKRAEADRETYIRDLLQLNMACERFVPREFLQFLDKTSIADVELGDQVQKEMSILFTDIVSFTAISEKMTPRENFQFINSFLSYLEPCITANHGFIDKYMGDAIMALFGGTANDAVNTGVAMLQTLNQYNQQSHWHTVLPIRIGIGINTGSLMLGTIGGRQRMDSTVISDAVNLAARLEKLTREYGIPLLISHQTFAELQTPEQYCIRKIDQVKVKGKSELITVYEVFDADPPELRSGKLVTAETFAAALSFYEKRRFKPAIDLFFDCIQQNPDDTVARSYLERCHKSRFQVLQEL